MKVSRTVLSSIIRRTLMEMPVDRGPTGSMVDIDQDEFQYNAAYGIVTTLFGPKRFDVVLSRTGGKVLQSIMVRSMQGKTSVYVPKMVEDMQKVITSSGFHNKMIGVANAKIDSIITENSDLTAGVAVAKRSVGYLIKAIFSLNIAEESFFALLYRFFPEESDFVLQADELMMAYGMDVGEMNEATTEEGTVTFGTKDLEFITSAAGMKGLARKVFDQVTKFYRFHGHYDDTLYADYGLEFGSVDDGDGWVNNFDTGWDEPGLKL